MTPKALKLRAENFLERNFDDRKEALEIYNNVIKLLETGVIRIAEKIDDSWKINGWIKQIILLGFKYGTLEPMVSFSKYSYYDKETMAPRQLTLDDRVRMVPGGSAIRCGSYIAPGTIIMPPAYINIGAYIDEGVMVDSHALVGSCAQVGKNVHISAGSQIGGVLEPVGSLPIIIEDNVFLGGNTGVYGGVIIGEGAVIGSGVVLNGSMQIFDNVQGEFIKATSGESLVVPKNAVVISGTRPITSGPGQNLHMQIYCPIIIKYRDLKTRATVTMEDILRN